MPSTETALVVDFTIVTYMSENLSRLYRWSVALCLSLLPAVRQAYSYVDPGGDLTLIGDMQPLFVGVATAIAVVVIVLVWKFIAHRKDKGEGE